MAAMTEAWIAGVGLPRSTVRQARRAEDEGWDGIGLVDSQNLAADPFAELALAASATSRILLGTAVTNPITRHPAATAAAIATVHAEQHFEYHRPLGVGDVLSVTTRPGATWEKEGRRAGRLTFAETITEYRNQDGDLVVTARSVGVRTERAAAS